METNLLLVIAAVVACGTNLPLEIQAQPSGPRAGVWYGTNNTGTILHVEEDNSNPRRGPVLRGWLHDSSGVHPLRGPVFSYSDNTFRAEYLGGGKTNRVEVVYKVGNEKAGTAIGVWNSERVTFYESRP